MARYLVLGGVRSGKSDLAERIADSAAGGGPVTYVATAEARDREMAARAEQHRRRRPEHWNLIEEPISLGRILVKEHLRTQVLLIDCMSLWTSNLLLSEREGLAEQKNEFLAALASHEGTVVVVSNEVGLGLIGMDALSRQFADALGHLNQDLASQCEHVYFTAAGLPMVLKGDPPPC